VIGRLALIFLVSITFARVAQAAPISFNTALPVAKGEFVFREQFIVNQSGDDPSTTNRDRTSWSATSVLGFGATRNLALFGVIPYVNNSLDVTTGGTRQTRSADGLGDMRLFSRYTLFQRDWPARTLRLAPFVGLEFPTGDDDERDSLGRLPPSVQPGSGSWDPFGGLVLTYQTLNFQFDSQLSYKLNTQANNFEFGDVARFDASLQYRLWPRKLSTGTPGFLYGVLETNFIYQGKNQLNGTRDLDSGGFSLFLMPGLQYVTKRWILETGVQLPAYQHLNGDGLETDYVFRGGFRINF